MSDLGCQDIRGLFDLCMTTRFAFWVHTRSNDESWNLLSFFDISDGQPDRWTTFFFFISSPFLILFFLLRGTTLELERGKRILCVWGKNLNFASDTHLVSFFASLFVWTIWFVSVRFGREG